MNKVGVTIFLHALMRALVELICLLNSINSNSQNAIVGNGFAGGWGGPCGNNSNFIYFSPGAGSSYTSGILLPNNTGNQYWRIGIDWGGTIKQLHTNTTGTDEIIASNTTYTLNSNCVSTGAMFFNVGSTAYHYIFKTKDAGTNPSNELVVFEVQGLVQTINSISQYPVAGSVTAGQPVSVTANLSGSLSAGQSVYLRYSTTSNFITSTVINMSGAGTSYSAMIPSATNTSAATVYYYAFTSGNANVAADGSNADFYTINSENNAGNNYSYTVFTTGTVYLHNFNNNSTTITNANPYSTNPTATTPAGIFNSYLGSSVWSGVSSFIGANGNGNTGCLAVLTTTNPIILTLQVNPGYSFSLSSFSFWTRTSNNATWTMSVNGIYAGSGSASAGGSNTGAIMVSNLIADLAGTITIIITLGGSGSFRLDDFALNGNVIPSTSYNPVIGLSVLNNCFNSADIILGTPSKYNNSNNTIVVFAKAGSAILNGIPSLDVSSYSANSSFGSGTSYENDASAFCVYKGDGTTISLSNLLAGTTYYLLAYNVLDPYTYSTAITASFSTLAVLPGVSSPVISQGNGQLIISWTNPLVCLDEIMVIATDNASVTTSPSGDGTLYTANAIYNDGSNASNLNINEFCIYRGPSTSVTMIGLVNGTAYNLKIFVRKGFVWSSGIAFSGTPVTVFSGDFRSKQSGLWTALTTWEQYSGGLWIAATAFPNSISSDVTIQPGTIISVDGPGPYALKNLNISASAKLFSNNTSTTTNIYLSVFGNIVCNGTIGNAPANDNLAFNIESSSCIINGVGTFTTSRIRKFYNTNSITAVTMDMNITTQWNASAAIYNGNTNTTAFNMTINAGRTLTVLNGGNVSIHGSSGSGFNNSHGTYTINGTLTITGNLILVNSNNNVLYPSNIKIGSTGVINTSFINAGASGLSGSKISIASGGLLNITGTGGFTAFSNTNNTYSIDIGSTIQYSAAGAQTLEASLSYSNLVISGSGIKSANNNVAIANSLLLSSATYSQTGFTTTISAGGILTGNGGDFGAGIAGGTINFAGSANINGTSPLNFNNLIVNAGLVAVSITNCSSRNLAMVGGEFRIGAGNQFNIANGGSVNASAGDFSSGPSGGILNFPGAGNFSGSCNPFNVYMSGGVNFGNGPVTIQSGGSLRINTGGFADTYKPFFAIGSTLVYNTGGIYNRSIEWDQLIPLGTGYPHHVIVQNGTTLNLGFNSPSNLEIGGNLYIGTNTSGNNKVTMNALSQALKIQGDLIIGDVATTGNELQLSSAPGGDLELFGNFTRYTANNYFSYGNRAICFKGNSNAVINAGIQKFYSIRLQKTGNGDVTLNCPLTIESNAEFTTGKINSTPVNILTFEPPAIVSGTPSEASYINGPAAKQYLDPGDEFLFPLGKAGEMPIYNPCGIAPVNINGFTTFTAEYIIEPVQQQTLMSAFLAGLINTGYWNISNSNNLSTARIKLYYNNPGPGEWIFYDGSETIAPFYSTATDPCQTCNVGVVHRKSLINTWSFTSDSSNFSSSLPEYRYYTDNGFIYSTPVSGSGPFSLGYGYHIILLLPVKILSFSGHISGNTGRLDWEVDNTNLLEGFELQYSRDGNHFKKLTTINGANTPGYSYLHKNLEHGKHFYRLLVKEKNGKTSLSQVIHLTTGTLKTEIVGLLGNPVKDKVAAIINSASFQKANAIITDASGRQIERKETQLFKGTNLWQVDAITLKPNGLYFIKIETLDGIKSTMKFFKQ